MTQIMTPSAESKIVTARQIDKAVANYRALLEKHASEFDSETFQTVLGQSELAVEQFALLRSRVEAISNLIVRRAKVNCARKPQEVLDATGRKQYTDRKVVNSMPQGEGEEVEVVFFNIGRYVNDEQLEKEYQLRGLKPIDPYSLAAVNEADPAFADKNPNATHWKDSDGYWCFVTFHLWGGARGVGVDRDGRGWGDGWWCAGVRM